MGSLDDVNWKKALQEGELRVAEARDQEKKVKEEAGESSFDMGG
jgi:hypothetical protein